MTAGDSDVLLAGLASWPAMGLVTMVRRCVAPGKQQGGAVARRAPPCLFHRPGL